MKKINTENAMRMGTNEFTELAKQMVTNFAEAYGLTVAHACEILYNSVLTEDANYGGIDKNLACRLRMYIAPVKTVY